MLRNKALAAAIGSVFAASTLGATGLLTPVGAHAEESERRIEEVVVTGSRIQQANVTASSPVTQIGQEELTFTGITRVEDFMRYLPQVYMEQGTGVSNGATGTATINLRNLGPARTLVLVNGRRLPPGSPLQGGEVSDVNQIPGALIDRVEVLTGGASSVYGSDAVAGVVNFILQDNFQGVQLDYQFSQYMHRNENRRIQDAIREGGFEVPRGTNNDGDISDFSLIIGGNLEDGRGNVTAYATYRNIEAVTQAARDYSGCALDATATTCAGSGTSAEGSFSDFGVLPASGLGPSYSFHVQGEEFVPGLLSYNYGPLNYWQRPDERYTAGAFAHFDFNDQMTVYSEFMFMDNQTVSQIAPSGAFFITDSLSCGNPFLTAQQFEAVCGAYGLTEDDTQVMFIGRRNVEGGPRQQDLRHTTFRGVLGVRGDINPTWSYDVSAQFAEVTMQNTYLNDMSTTRIGRALNAVTDDRTQVDPATGATVPVNPDTFGQAVCQSVIDNSDPACVPWNIFQTGAVTPEMIDYLVLPLFARGTTDQTVATAYVQGRLGDYGWRMPTADTGIDVVLGVNWYDVSLDFNPDQGFRGGDGAGQGGATLAVDNVGYDVTEGFMEASVPLVEGRPWVQSLALDLGYRYSDYSTGETADTFKIAGAWDIDEQIKVRGSFNRAIRAAQLRELFLPQGFNLFDMAADPCGGPVTGGATAQGRTLEECARTGVTPDQFGNIANSPAGQYNFLQGGNPALAPEEADTISFGVVYTPNFLENLVLSVDAYEITVEKAISNLNPEFILNQCLDTGEPLFCEDIRRGAGNGSLWIGSDVDVSGRVSALNANIGFFEVRGIDFIVDYSFDIADWGRIGVNNVLGYIDSWRQQEVAGGPIQRCEGRWGGVCGPPTLDIKNNMRVTWYSPWNVLLSANWRHLGEVDDISTAGVNLGSRDYIDLAAVWEATEQISVRAGANNVFDRAPPIAGGNAGPSFYGNGNTFPSTYDALGRYWFLALSVGLGNR
jgi:iron complex outermembrane recepter protein